MKLIKTSRLYLREMIIKDAQSIYELNLDPDVIKYTGDISFNDIDDASQFLQNYNHYNEYGFGRWAVLRKSDERFLGWCGLKYSPNINEYDIGFRFHKRYWGKGYATEAAEACLRWAFQNIETDLIFGRAMAKNIASCKVLEKIGLSFFESRLVNGDEQLIYQIRNLSNK